MLFRTSCDIPIFDLEKRFNMKNLFLTLVISCMSITAVFAQLNEGHIAYKIDASSDTPEMQMAIGMLQGSTLNIFFKDKKTRSEMKMGSMMTVTTITDETSQDVLMLMSGMVGNNAIKSKMTDLKTEEGSTEEIPEFELTLVDESKVIEGYNCKKAIVTSEDGIASVFWYTQDIVVASKGQNYLNSKVPGFPMQFEINNKGLKMTMTATKVEQKLDKKKATELFNMTIPEGYTEMSQDDLKMMGGMGM
jgi:GLPGLI family protein